MYRLYSVAIFQSVRYRLDAVLKDIIKSTLISSLITGTILSPSFTARELPDEIILYIYSNAFFIFVMVYNNRYCKGVPFHFVPLKWNSQLVIVILRNVVLLRNFYEYMNYLPQSDCWLCPTYL